MWAEKDGNLDTVTAEDKAYEFWARQMAARAERRAIRELTATRALKARQDCFDAIPAVAPAAHRLVTHYAELGSLRLLAAEFTARPLVSRSAARRCPRRSSPHRGRGG